jgi:hypothetical protein
MAGLLLDQPQVLLLFVEPDHEGMAKHGWIQRGNSRLLPHPADLAVQAHTAERRASFAQQQSLTRLGAAALKAHESLKGPHHLLRDCDDPVGSRGPGLDVQLGSAVMRRSISNT